MWVFDSQGAVVKTAVKNAQREQTRKWKRKRYRNERVRTRRVSIFHNRYGEKAS